MYISRVRLFRDSRQQTSHANLLMVVEPMPVEEDEGPDATPIPEAQSRGKATSTSRRLRRWWSQAKL